MGLSDILAFAWMLSLKEVQGLTEICRLFFLIKSCISSLKWIFFFACFFFFLGCLYITVLTSSVSGRSKRLLYAQS